MLDQELITLSKLRIAFDLKSTELETLTIKLQPHATPYTLWHNAYKMHWEAHIENNAAPLELEIPTFPQANDEQFSVSDCAEEMCEYLVEIIPLVYQRYMCDGLQYIFEETYNPMSKWHWNYMDVVLQRVPSRKDFKHLTPLEAAHAKKKAFMKSHATKILKEVFIDTIAVNKRTAVQHLVACGYPFTQEVKGLSRGYFDYVTAETFATPTEKAQVEVTQNTDTKTKALCIPRELWEGKSPSSVRDAMREANYDDAVIAYVLYTWCGQNNKTHVGRLLGAADKEDSTYRKFCHRLLEKAQSLNITTK